MDEFKRKGHLHDKSMSGRKQRKADKARARMNLREDLQEEIRSVEQKDKDETR